MLRLVRLRLACGPLSKPDATIQLAPITEAEALEVALWRYDPPYAFYNGSEAEVAVMLDSANRYRAVHVKGEFVGYVCAGPDARVAGQEPDADIDDLGWGFRPDLTGRRLASRWLPAVLALLADELTAPRQRVVIVAWNERSQAVARRLGFGGSVSHTGGGVEWVVMMRQRPAGAQ